LQLNLLGALEVVDDGRQVVLGGVKQRATLGLLLLRNNSLVPLSALRCALWPENPPPTWRKMLHNAISQLRYMFSASRVPADSPLLLTSAPGYLLRIDSEQIDLCRFQALAERGRAELGAGSCEQASRTLRDALALWRGAALADLVEQGISWPELTAVQNARLTVLEDRVEADIAVGRHSEVVADLAALAETEPLRERLCGQLMRALYYSGRQGEALATYHRTRTELIDQLGLDPGPELQELQRAILNHELALPAPSGSAAPRPHAPARLMSASPPDTRLDSGADDADESVALPEATALAEADAPSVAPHEEVRQVTVVLIKAAPAPELATGPEELEITRREVGAAVREEVERCGGTVTGSLGPLWAAAFGVSRNRDSDAHQAVRAAVAISDRLGDRVTVDDGATVGSMAVSAAVATGDALIRTSPAHPARDFELTSTVLDQCLRLLADIRPAEVRVCTATKQASDHSIGYTDSADRDGGWTVAEVELEPADAWDAAPCVGRDHELRILAASLDWVRHREQPRLVTVLGDAGIGKSRLVAEFLDGLAECRPLLLRVGAGSDAGDGMAAVADLVRRHAGISATDPDEVAREKLVKTVCGLGGHGDTSLSMLRNVHALLGLGHDHAGDDPVEAWRLFFEELAADRPTVVVVEDLHLAADGLLEFVDQLAGRTVAVPLLLVATARFELLERRPDWCGGKLHTDMITLAPLSRTATAELLRELCPEAAHHGVIDAVMKQVGGNPFLVREYARLLNDGDHAPSLVLQRPDRAIGRPHPEPPPWPASLPRSVRRVLDAQMDELPREARAVLMDAAVLDPFVTPAAVSALSGCRIEEAGVSLDLLVRRHFLSRSRHAAVADRTYLFPNAALRDVAYGRLSRRVLIDKHERAIAWIERLPGDLGDLSTWHHTRLAMLSDRFSSPDNRQVAYQDDRHPASRRTA
jgi:DNA-binding SARP family transcriptional activator